MRKKLMKVGFFRLGSAVLVSAMMLTSCSKGFDNDETFSSKVTNSQLASPVLSKANFTTLVNSDGSESIKVAWDAVMGAGGYYYRVDNMDSGEPVLLDEGETDKSLFLFPKAEDTKYLVTVKTLGNAKLNNTEAQEATVFAYSTMIEAQTIPAGENIVNFVKSHMVDTEDEQAFELVGGASYTIDDEVDFGRHKVTFRGNKLDYPIVTLKGQGCIRTAAGLKVKWIKFDCTEQESKGVFECSSVAYPELETNKAGWPDKAYYLPDPIIFQDCWFKNVKMCLFFSGARAWALEDVRIDNCIVQLNNDGTKFGDAAVIGTYSGTAYYRDDSQTWSSAIRNVTIKNSTIYNLKDNSKDRMIRFQSNQLGRVFDSQYGGATLTNNTIIKVMSDKEFANNTPNRVEYSITFNGNICYDCWRLQKFIQGNNPLTLDITKNTIWGLKNSVDGTDKTRCATEENAFGYTSVEELNAALKELDLTKPNGGVNFKASGAISSTIGDPRWLE